MRETTAPATQRFDSVDVLRGLSIACVVLLHSWLRFAGSHHNFSRWVKPHWLFSLLFGNGEYGVTVFFAVSGFLITTTSLRRFGGLHNVVPRIFYRIRFARIAPLLLASLFILGTLHFAHVDGFVIKQMSYWRAALGALTFHLNWLEATRGYLPANWDVMWSLSIEEMFYVFFPPVCAFVLRWKHGMWIFLALLIALVVLAPFGRTRWAKDDIAAEKSYLGGMGSIALGCMTAMLLDRWRRRDRIPNDRALLWLACAGAAWMVFATGQIHLQSTHPLMHWIAVRDLDDSLLTLGTCMVMLGLVARNRAGSRLLAPVRWLGRLSYEVYMTHEFVVIAIVNLALFVGRRTGGRGFHYGLLAWVALILLLSAALGWLVARTFSEPMNRRLRGAPHPAELPAAGARTPV
jgi:peptidoglycan/LPS O-acetylase OafA/YrhL